MAEGPGGLKGAIGPAGLGCDVAAAGGGGRAACADPTWGYWSPLGGGRGWFRPCPGWKAPLGGPGIAPGRAPAGPGGPMLYGPCGGPGWVLVMVGAWGPRGGAPGKPGMGAAGGIPPDLGNEAAL